MGRRSDGERSIGRASRSGFSHNRKLNSSIPAIHIENQKSSDAFLLFIFGIFLPVVFRGRTREMWVSRKVRQRMSDFNKIYPKTVAVKIFMNFLEKSKSFYSAGSGGG